MKKSLKILFFVLVFYIFLFLFYLLFLFTSNIYVLEEVNYLIVWLVIIIILSYIIYVSGIIQQKAINDALDTGRLQFFNFMYNLVRTNNDLTEQKLRSRLRFYILNEIINQLILECLDFMESTKKYLEIKYSKFKYYIVYIVVYIIFPLRKKIRKYLSMYFKYLVNIFSRRV